VPILWRYSKNMHFSFTILGMDYYAWVKIELHVLVCTLITCLIWTQNNLFLFSCAWNYSELYFCLKSCAYVFWSETSGQVPTITKQWLQYIQVIYEKNRGTDSTWCIRMS
jgi:hypothetical protein